MRLVFAFHPGTTIADLERVYARLSGFEQPLLSIGGILSDKMALNFARQPWPPIKDSTNKRKRMAERGQLSLFYDPLVRTGAMKGAATEGNWQSGRLGGGSFMAILEIPGYSAFHMPKSEGGYGPTRFMPVRDFAFIQDDLSQEVGDIIMDWVTS